MLLARTRRENILRLGERHVALMSGLLGAFWKLPGFSSPPLQCHEKY
jgi:hypothetical protein